MTRHLLTLCTLFIALISTAQIVVDKDSSFQSGSISDFEIIAKNTIYNTTSIDDTLRWIRIGKTLSAGWETASCDNQTCWFPEIDSNQFVVPANGSANLDIYFYPQDNEGTGETKILLYRVNEGRNSADTLIYQASNLPVGLSNTFNIPDLSVYPNPVIDKFTVNYSSNELLNASIFKNGQLIIENSIETGSSIDISAFSKGTYFLKLSGANNQNVIKIIKQ